TTTLSAQRNYPTTRPKTVGNSILTNGGFENPIPTAIPTPPSIPSKYPKHLLPDLPHDTFYEDGEDPVEDEAGPNEEGSDDEGGEEEVSMEKFLSMAKRKVLNILQQKSKSSKLSLIATSSISRKQKNSIREYLLDGTLNLEIVQPLLTSSSV
ncbi:MAG: hypothetical protein HXN24_08130, partial [Porphyromonas sp.]|nr:hypothetical protein [Porphyromonas sp.]